MHAGVLYGGVSATDDSAVRRRDSRRATEAEM
jgi:hypothetical protein